MGTEILKEHWETSKLTNENLIIQNKVQIAMAEQIIIFCDKKIKEFPEEEPK